jgi:predicted nicotinamide N-methyase
MTPAAAAMESFVQARTRLGDLPYLPGIRLHLADEVFGLWEDTGELPYWGFAWAGGLGLARFVLDHPELVRGRRVLDVASGSGLVAIAAAKAGAASVVANDISPLAMAAITLNAAANGVTLRTSEEDLFAAAAATATADPDDLAPGDDRAAAESTAAESTAAEIVSTGSEHDVVLAGDVFYDRVMAAAAWPFLRRAGRQGALVLIGDPDRAYLPRTHLYARAAYGVPVSPLIEDATTKRVTVWTWPPPAPERPGPETSRTRRSQSS